ncbi:MAG: rhodanese-like domain-containing protein [Spirochaetales bacterium]|nr:rhodanese-like domain-containing protein [Spirochaetales bacterium]
MKRLTVFLILFALAAGSAAAKDYTKFSDLKELLDSDADDYIFLDVRTDQEYRAGHIPGSVNIPYEQLPDALPEGTALDKTIILYCRSGNRSGQAARALKRAGYTDVYNFGGINQWKGDLQK